MLRFPRIPHYIDFRKSKKSRKEIKGLKDITRTYNENITLF